MRMGLAMPAANMHAAKAKPQPGDDGPRARENASKKAADEEGAVITVAPATFCSHCTRLLRHNGGRKAIASPHTRMTMDLQRVTCQARDTEIIATRCAYLAISHRQQ